MLYSKMSEENSIENDYKAHPLYTNYGANKLGWITNLKTDRVLRPRLKSTGYLQIDLYKEGKRKTYMVHRFVFECFYGLIPYKICINHKDLNKINNKLENLEVVTYSENSKHMYRERPEERKRDRTPRKVIAINIETSEETIYLSISKASISLGINPGHISRIARNIPGDVSRTSKKNGKKYRFKFP